jgi:hypothetical protein
MNELFILKCSNLNNSVNYNNIINKNISQHFDIDI